jgi:hypothetical protein
MFRICKNYFTDYKQYLSQRFSTATHRKQGLISGSLLGALYAGIRGSLIKAPLVIPMIGTVSNSSSSRFILSCILGGTAGANIGDQLGQSIDVWQENKPLSNEIFLMRVLPILFSVTGNFIVHYYELYEGKPIFESIEQLTSFEIYLFSTFVFASLGRTAGFRGGQLFDFFTNDTLIGDFGLFRLGTFIKNRINNSYTEEREVNTALRV